MIARAACCMGVVMCGLLGVAISPASHAAPPPSATESHATPVWPNDGIAQRRFDGGGVMFVEDDHGTLRAWVLSDYRRPDQIDQDHAWAQALDFFSGKVMKVKVVLEEDGHESEAFIDPRGAVHVYSVKPRFRFSGTAMGLSLAGMNFSGHSINVSAGIGSCSVHLDAAAPKKNWNTGLEPATVWQKFPIYHSGPSSRGCPSGELASAVDAALDLGDGTFLASEGCYVFRLRKSDMSPVGSAPSLRVVDEATVNAELAKLHGTTIDDPTGYLIKALSFPTSPELSCKVY